MVYERCQVGMLTTHYVVSQRVRVISRQINRGFFLAPQLQQLRSSKDLFFPFKTAPRLSYFKGCTQEHTIYALLNLDIDAARHLCNRICLRHETI